MRTGLATTVRVVRARPAGARARPLGVSAAAVKGLAPGFGAAGVKRFPTIGDVFNALKAKQRFAASEDTARAFGVLERLCSVLDHAATPHVIEGRQGTHLALSLRTALRMLRAKERADGCSGHMRLAEMFRLVRLLDRGPALPVRLAQRRTGPDGPPKIYMQAVTPLPPGMTAAWVLLPDAKSRARWNSTSVLQSAMVQRYLPDLAGVDTVNVDSELLLRRKHDIVLAIADLNEQWRAGGSDKGPFGSLLWCISNAASKVPDGVLSRVELFGSRLYNVCREDSDIDVAVTVRSPRENWVGGLHSYGSRFARALGRESGITSAQWIPTARVPIIKFRIRYRRREYGGDIVFNNGLGMAKSNMLAAYMNADPRVRPFMTLLKHWSQARLLASSNTLNSFGIMMMGLAFLISQRVVPPLQLLSTIDITEAGWQRLAEIHQTPELAAEQYADARCVETGCELPKWEVEGHAGYFCNSLRGLKGWRSPNRTPTIALLFEMFRFYGTRFDPLRHAISPRLGSPCLPRASLCELNAPSPGLYLPQPHEWPQKLRFLAIEDPFEHTRNTGGNVPPAWALGLLWEMRRGAWALAQSLQDPNAPILDRLFAPPTGSIYPDAAIWAPVYSCLLDELQKALSEPVFDKERDVRPENTIDLQNLETATPDVVET
ncbi:hypothetical protein H4R21_002249, partial [Coemansia helicoidea]